MHKDMRFRRVRGHAYGHAYGHVHARRTKWRLFAKTTIPKPAGAAIEPLQAKKMVAKIENVFQKSKMFSKNNENVF